MLNGLQHKFSVTGSAIQNFGEDPGIWTSMTINVRIELVVYRLAQADILLYPQTDWQWWIGLKSEI